MTTEIGEKPISQEQAVLERIGDLDQLRKLGVESMEEAQVVAHLSLAGEKTIQQLADEMFWKKGGRGSELRSRRNAYVRMMRVLQRLEKKGAVAKKLFGREKPYHVTEELKDYLAIRTGGPRATVVGVSIPRWDLACCVATVGVALAFLVGLLAIRMVALFEEISGFTFLFVAWSGLCILLGISIRGLIPVIRRVL